MKVIRIRGKGGKVQFFMSYEGWQSASLAGLALIVLVACVTDLRRRRIPNALILVALAVGLLVNLAGPQAAGAGGLFTLDPGALGWRGALFGALAGLGLFLPLYLMRAMGAGDVKLLAGVGSFVGPAAVLNLALFILAMGGLLALARMVLTRTSRRVMGNVMLMLMPVVTGTPRLFDPGTQTAHRMPYALAFAAGLLAYGAWIFQGMAPPIRF